MKKNDVGQGCIGRAVDYEKRRGLLLGNNSVGMEIEKRRMWVFSSLGQIKTI